MTGETRGEDSSRSSLRMGRSGRLFWNSQYFSFKVNMYLVRNDTVSGSSWRLLIVKLISRV